MEREKGPAVLASHQGTKHRKEAIMNVPVPATILLQPHESPQEWDRRTPIQTNPNQPTNSEK